MTAPLLIARLDDAVVRARAIFCDIWGVLHNGVAAFPGVSEALSRVRRRGIPVVLLSNAPRPGQVVRHQLDRLGVLPEAYDAIVTSGDVCRDMIDQRRPQRFTHLGPERDRPLFEGLGLEPVPADEAQYLLCTGLLDDTRETPEDYRERLSAMARRGLPMLCANPDLVIDRGGKEIYCAGALAQLYQSLGGTATVIGKPNRDAYDYALARARALTGNALEPVDILAIGDSFRTDIAGAAGFGCQSLFIAAGIHASEYLDAAGRIDAAKARQALAHEPFQPDFLMARLA
jgi:HAD superfamily hydrolase (TIGR01459 family)